MTTASILGNCSASFAFLEGLKGRRKTNTRGVDATVSVRVELSAISTLRSRHRHVHCRYKQTPAEVYYCSTQHRHPQASSLKLVASWCMRTVAQRSTAQHSTAQCSAVQCRTVQCSNSYLVDWARAHTFWSNPLSNRRTSFAKDGVSKNVPAIQLHQDACMPQP